MPNELRAPSNVSLLRDLAASTMVRYPQYDGHFAKYEICRITREIRTKAGRAFAAGEIVIARKPDPKTDFHFPGTPRFITAWSYANTIDTSVPAGAVEWL